MSNFPLPDTVMPVGEYRGVPLAEVPLDRLEWFLRTIVTGQWRGRPLDPEVVHDLGLVLLERLDADGNTDKVTELLALLRGKD